MISPTIIMSDPSTKKMIIPCPTCRKPVEWASNAFRPFCSKRCQTLDQAAWASEEYTISSPPDESASSDEMK